jgi:hypothetical protein
MLRCVRFARRYTPDPIGFRERALQRGERWRAGRTDAKGRARCIAGIDVEVRNGMDCKDDASAASSDTRVEQSERMTDVTVISGRD